MIRVSGLDPGILVGSRFFGWIRVFWLDPGFLVGSGFFLDGSGYFGWIRVFWSDPGFLVGSWSFGPGTTSQYFQMSSIFFSNLGENDPLCKRFMDPYPKVLI